MAGRSSPHGSRLWSRRGFLGVATATAGGFLAGCITRGESSHLSGQLVIDGSNTVLPHGAAVALEFMWRNNRVSIPVRGSGTGAGFQRFCAGETTIQNASRRILPGEEEACRANGVDWIELDALLDGIAIMRNPANHWSDCFTVDELRRIWERDSTVQTWGDIRPEWEDEPYGDQTLELYGRDSASGTFDYFTEHITGEIGNIRRDYSGTPDTNVIVRGVRGNQHALGFGGAGFYFENQDDLDLVAVDGGDGCILPSRTTIEERTYQPLSRPMFVYIRKEALRRELVREYTRFFFKEVDAAGYEQAEKFDIIDPGETLTWTQWAARRVGFFAIDEETVAANAAKLEDAIAEVT